MPTLETPEGGPVETGARSGAATAEPSPPLALWWTLSIPDGGGTSIRVTEEDDRWLITDVYIHGAALTATDLQAVPMSGLDVVMNLIGYSQGGITDPAVIADAHNALAAEAGYGNAVICDLDDAEPSLAELRALAADAPPALPRTPAAARPKLTRPDGTDPDGFAEKVAAAYREYAQATRAPAVRIADEAGVPIATVRSWIREARRRGKLPEGRKGKAG